MIFGYYLFSTSNIPLARNYFKLITSPNIFQFSGHIPYAKKVRLNSIHFGVRFTFASPRLFNSRLNNRALLLRRLLFIFCSCWRRLLLRDKFFTCLFVESLSLPLIISAIVIFIATDVAMIIIFISSSSISPSLFSSVVVFLFFFIQKIQCEWCGYPSCWLPTIVRFLSHGKFWVWRWWMDTSHEDWRQRGA